MDIFERLYNGSIYPAEQIRPNHPDYRQTNEEINTILEQLKDKLTIEEGERLDRLESLYLKVYQMNCVAAFSSGFRLAARLLCETFTKE